MRKTKINESLGTAWYTFYAKIRPWILVALAGIFLLGINPETFSTDWGFTVSFTLLGGLGVAAFVLSDEKRDYQTFVKFVNISLYAEVALVAFICAFAFYQVDGTKFAFGNAIFFFIMVSAIGIVFWRGMNKKYFERRILRLDRAETKSDFEKKMDGLWATKNPEGAAAMAEKEEAERAAAERAAAEVNRKIEEERAAIEAARQMAENRADEDARIGRYQDPTRINGRMGSIWFSIFAHIRPFIGGLASLLILFDFVIRIELYLHVYWIIPMFFFAVPQLILHVLTFIKSGKNYHDFVRYSRWALIYEIAYTSYLYTVNVFVYSFMDYQLAMITFPLTCGVLMAVWYLPNMAYLKRRMVKTVVHNKEADQKRSASFLDKIDAMHKAHMEAAENDMLPPDLTEMSGGAKAEMETEAETEATAEAEAPSENEMADEVEVEIKTAETETEATAEAEAPTENEAETENVTEAAEENREEDGAADDQAEASDT